MRMMDLRHLPVATCTALLLALTFSERPARAQSVAPFAIHEASLDRSESWPSIAVFPDGSFVISWISSLFDFVSPDGRVMLRRFDRLGNPLSGALRVDETRPDLNEAFFARRDSRVAALHDGGCAVIWLDARGGNQIPANEVRLRTFNASMQPEGSLTEVVVFFKDSETPKTANVLSGGTFALSPNVLTDGDELLLVWQESPYLDGTARTKAQRWGRFSQAPLAPPMALLEVDDIELGSVARGGFHRVHIASLPGGAFVAAWNRAGEPDPDSDGSIFLSGNLSLQVFEADSSPRGSEVVLHGETDFPLGDSHLASDPDGKILSIAASVEPPALTNRISILDEEGSVLAKTRLEPPGQLVRVVAIGSERFAVARLIYESVQPVRFSLLVSITDADGRELVDPLRLLLGEQEALLEMAYLPTNELVLILESMGDLKGQRVTLPEVPCNACVPCQPSETRLCLDDGRFSLQADWTNFSGLEGTGKAVQLTKDTGYFWFFNDTNVELVTKVLDGRALNDHFWVFYGALSNVEYRLKVTDTTTGRVRVYDNPSGQFASVGDTSAFFSLAGESYSSAYTRKRGQVTSARETACPDEALCLGGGRFQVRVNWENFKGQTGVGHPQQLTQDTGYFWFFNAENVELVLKVLDGRAITGHYWVFYGALSNVKYVISVTDVERGLTRYYENAAGTFASRGDTQAFPEEL